jgi:hypothetical protein
MVLTTQELKAAISDARLSVQEARAALLTGANLPLPCEGGLYVFGSF